MTSSKSHITQYPLIKMQHPFTTEEKHRICDLLENRFQNSTFYRPNGGANDGRGKFGVSIGLIAADMTYFLNRTWIQKDNYGPSKWQHVAQQIGYQRHAHLEWRTAETHVYKYITTQLTLAKDSAMTGIVVDDAGIGKTHAAKEFAQNNTGVIYIDCSVHCRKCDFIRELAKKVGVEPNQKLTQLESAAIYGIQMMDAPLIILDEAGDLENTTLLVVKRLFNALEDSCGIVMIGSDGLRSRLERGVQYRKLGYTEVYSRFGKRFNRATPVKVDEKVSLFKKMALEMALANGIEDKSQLEMLENMMLQPDKSFSDMRGAKRKILGLKKRNAQPA